MSADSREVVAVRLAGFERFAVDQMANLAGESRSDVMRNAIFDAMRRMMKDHPQWPMHPAWSDANPSAAWIAKMFQFWAYAVAAPDPEVYLEPVKLDGIKAYRLRGTKGPTPKLTEWPEHVERYHARKAKEAK